MRDKQVARVQEAIGGTLHEGEQVELAVQAVITSVPAEQGRLAGAARELTKRVNARAAARSEGFAVLTSGLVIRGQADALNAALSASTQTENA